MNRSDYPKSILAKPTPSSAPRLIAATIGAALIATALNVVIARVATPIVGAPADYPSFAWLPILVGSVVGAIGAAIVFRVLQRSTRKPELLFAEVALGVLVASYVLPVLPLVMPMTRFVGVNWGIALVLMLMHTVTAATIVYVLSRVARSRV